MSRAGQEMDLPALRHAITDVEKGTGVSAVY